MLLQMTRSASSMAVRAAVEAVKPSEASSAPAPVPSTEREATLLVPSPSRAIVEAR